MYQSGFDLPPFDPTATVLNEQIDAYKNALEAVEKDFLDYQTASEREIDELNKYVEELRRYAEKQKVIIEDLESRDEVQEAQLKQVNQEASILRLQVAELREDLNKHATQNLTFSIAEEQIEHKYAVNSLENPRVINNLGAEVMYYKSLNQQLTNEKNALAQQVEQLSSTLENAQAANQQLEWRIQKNEESVKGSIESELRQQIYKAVILIQALGAPFDPTTEEFARSLRQAVMNENYCRNIKVDFKNSSMTLDEMVEQYLSRGLYLMGLKTESSGDSDKPWRQPVGEQLNDGSIVSEDFETFETLIRKNNVTRERFFVLQKDFQEMKNRADTAERRLGQLSGENEVLSKINFSSRQILKSIEDRVEQDRNLTNARLVEFTKQFDTALEQLNSEKAKLQDVTKKMQTFIKNDEFEHKEIKRSAEAIFCAAESVSNRGPLPSSQEILDLLGGILQQLEDERFEPEIIDMTTVLAKQYGVEMPDGMVPWLETKFEDFMHIIELKDAEIGKRNMAVGLLVARNSTIPQSTGHSADFNALIDDFVRRAKTTDFFRSFASFDLNLDEQFIIIEQQKEIEGLTLQIAEMQRASQDGSKHVELHFDEQLNIRVNEKPVQTLLEVVNEAGTCTYFEFSQALLELLLRETSSREKSISDALAALTQLVDDTKSKSATQTQQFAHLISISESLCRQLSAIAANIDSVSAIAGERGEVEQLLGLLSKQFASQMQANLAISEFLSAPVNIVKPLALPDTCGEDKSWNDIINATQQEFSAINSKILEIYAAVCADRREIQAFYANKKTLDAERFRVAQNSIKKLEIGLRKCANELANVRRAHVQMSSRDAAIIASLKAEIEEQRLMAQNKALEHARHITELESATKAQRQSEIASLREQITALKVMCGAE